MSNNTDQAMTAATAALVALSEEPKSLELAAARLQDALKFVRQAQTEITTDPRVAMTIPQAKALLEATTSSEEWNNAIIQIQTAFGGRFPSGVDVTPNFGNFARVRKRKDVG